MKFVIVLTFALAVSAQRYLPRLDEGEGPACEDSERYNCNGATTSQADPNDCSVFYNCDSNIQRPCPSTCPPGLYFDPALGVCNWPEAVPSCSARNMRATREEIEGPACAEEERYNCNGATTSQADPNDCSVFYNCDSNIQRPCPSTCPPGLYFDPVLGVCNWPEAVPSCSARNMRATREEIEGPACAEEERYECNGASTPQADPNDCSVFYNCDPQIQRPCPNTCPPGLFYDPVLGICNWPEAVPSCSATRMLREIREEIEGPACAEEERYECNGASTPQADPNDCSVFYNCDPQIQRPCPNTCPPGLFYDPVLGICNWPEAVPSCSA